MRHLTHRALEVLAHGTRMPPGGFKADTGHPACEPAVTGAPRKLDWCSVADVRAMARGWRYAYPGTGTVPHEIRPPTCPACCVLLDAALAKCSSHREESRP